MKIYYNYIYNIQFTNAKLLKKYHIQRNNFIIFTFVIYSIIYTLCLNNICK